MDRDMEKKKVYVPGMSRSLKDSEELIYDPKAYLLLQTFETDYPCLSFDIIPDTLGDNRQNYPMTAWLVTGTQADKANSNQLLVMRLSNIDESSDGDEEDDANIINDRPGKKEPRMHASLISHFGGVNRIKFQRLGSSDVCAVWNDQRKVQIWNLNPFISSVENISLSEPIKSITLKNEKPLFTKEYSAEGFALAWSSLQTGTLATGDHHKKIFLWKMAEGGKWLVDTNALTDHRGSVEDLVWSPSEESLLISCSTDRTIRLWDVRSPPKQSCVCTIKDAHEADVNVLSWNTGTDPLIVSGGDDGALKIWSLKTIQYNQPVAKFLHHQKPITSVEWSPHDSTVFISSGEDDQTTIWDLALEADEPNYSDEAEVDLLFIHMGQKEVKEVHWHKQCPGLALTTSLDGFHVFKTINS
ncbi:hypothetical protein Mgra_00006306 [Meloidogyne graminicola]|uniref:Glutamate-rich WD repeat-containing protein 1 n=1 Tax=Meloidogyne graminicola TaxID=189291 RepID=A0A8S9ZLP4_9BILA|nr:hypothetical protein Mgra_00006306 [Meloidogyne graminicola]